MDTNVIVAIIAVISALIGSLFGHWLTLRQLRRQQLETIRGFVHQRTLEAYEKLWVSLSPASMYDPYGKGIVIRKKDGIFLNRSAVIEFFTSLNTLFYSEHGLYLSKQMRTVIFTFRDFMLNLLEEIGSDEDEFIKISNSKAKKVEKGLDWLRRNARKEIGFSDVHFPTQDLDLK
jgi:hypothetical protein